MKIAKTLTDEDKSICKFYGIAAIIAVNLRRFEEAKIYS